jgi:hypothetical protein
MSTITQKVSYSLLSLALMFTLAFSFATLAFAHGGGAVDPADSNCMGQLARLHANGKNNGNNPDTVKGFGTDQSHLGLGGPYDSIQAQSKAFKAFCKAV